MDLAALRDLLIEWAEINSGSTNLAGLDRMRGALAHHFRQLPGAYVEHVPLQGTSAQILRILIRPQAAHQLLLSGHYDTVYGAHHVFQRCAMEGDRLRGPGVADMKGGLVAMLAAVREFLAQDRSKALGFEILLTPDEETGSVASAPVLEDAARRHPGAALVFEPARGNGNLVRARKGTGVFTLTCHGRSAHAANPAQGRNAILALAEYLPQVAELGADLAGVTVNIASIRGGGTINIVPEFAEAEINVRTSRVADEAEVIGCLHALAEPINQREGYALKITGGFNRPPKEVTSVEEGLFAAWQGCARELGVTLGWQDVGGGSDGNLFATAGLPCLDGLGPVGDHYHSTDEYIVIPTLLERAAIAARFFNDVATGRIMLPRRR